MLQPSLHAWEQDSTGFPSGLFLKKAVFTSQFSYYHYS